MRIKYFNFLLITIIMIMTTLTSCSNNSKNDLLIKNSLIPAPYYYQELTGKFDFPDVITINISDQAENILGVDFINIFSSKIGLQKTDKSNATIALVVNSEKEVFEKEQYELNIQKNKIELKAGDYNGFVYGMQSIIQYYNISKLQQQPIKCCKILDKPEFKWRGIMIDIARHMLPMDYIKEYIDMMSYFKLNTLHFHMTDDQGWRIEIKKYPKLTQIGSKRKQTLVGWQGNYLTEKDFVFDNQPYQGFYTQDELKDMVKYAQQRGITVVPEIEMPGHALALLSAYPELACSGKNFEAVGYWGVFDDIVCPTPQTINFFKDVLDEVCEIFPSQYIHIGGDEAPKKRWEESKYVQKLIKDENIEDVEHVQGWFNRQIESHLQSKGRKLIGWDEILEGGISKDATVMSWRGEEGGITAANKGNTVVMSPGSQGYYWDYKYSEDYDPAEIGRKHAGATVDKIYNYYPVPKDIAEDNRELVLGIQANLWSEYIKNPNQHQYLSFPRMFAISEVGWSTLNNKNWENFIVRTAPHYSLLIEKNYNFKVIEPLLRKIDDKYYLYSPVSNSSIYYTTDGTIPNKNSSKATTEPIKEKKITAIAISTDGRTSAPVEFELK